MAPSETESKLDASIRGPSALKLTPTSSFTTARLPPTSSLLLLFYSFFPSTYLQLIIHRHSIDSLLRSSVAGIPTFFTGHLAAVRSLSLLPTRPFNQANALLRFFRKCDMTVSYVKGGLILLIASEAVQLAQTTMAAGTQVFPQVMMRGAILFLCNSHNDDATMQCFVFARHSPFDTYLYATENIN